MAISIPVSVVMERRIVSSGRWSQAQWRAVAAVGGEDVADTGRGCTLIDESGGRRRYLWSGLELELFKDGCESYWYNLMSDNPCLFVVCFEDDAAECRDALGRKLEVWPALVTANQDEANAHLESDDPVSSVPMPLNLHQRVERFVVEHYVPEQKKKRKRRNWTSPGADSKVARAAESGRETRRERDGDVEAS